jgi:acyl carrier protein phosphodiesterase
MEGIRRSLHGMAKRTKFNSGLETGTSDLIEYFSLFEIEFNSFFPELINHVQLIKDTRN